MYEIKADELKVLKCMVHAETLDSVIAETGLSVNVVIDIVKHLRHYRYLKPVDDNGKEISMFEADKIRRVRFILTAKGFTELENLPGNSDTRIGNVEN